MISYAIAYPLLVTMPRSSPDRTASTSQSAPAPRRARSELEQVYVKDRAAWRKWLARNHDRSPGIWLVYDR